LAAVSSEDEVVLLLKMIMIRSGKSEKKPRTKFKKSHLVLLMICCELKEVVPKVIRVIGESGYLGEFLGEEFNKLLWLSGFL
jgi:hypothetical protein